MNNNHYCIFQLHQDNRRPILLKDHNPSLFSPIQSKKRTRIQINKDEKYSLTTS